MKAPRARATRRRLTPEHRDPGQPDETPAPRQRAARRRVLSAEALEELGLRKLAELLMGLAERDPAVARSLRLELAGSDGPGRLAAEVEKRLRTLQRARSFVEWDKVRPLAHELDGLRQTIAGALAESDPHAGVAQMRLLLSLHEGIFERSDDSSGALGEVFRDAGADLGRLWSLLPGRDPIGLAQELLELLDRDDYGVTDRLLAASGSALGPDGRAELRRLLEARLAVRSASRRDDFGESRGRFTTSLWLRELADLEGDVDAFVAAVEAGGRAENFAADIAQRLTASGRAAESLLWLDRARDRHKGEDRAHLDLRIAALEALGRQEEVQTLRWAAFQSWLSVPHLRAYLRGLPDFDDIKAEDRAIAHALAHSDRGSALAFLTTWPNLDAANRLVRAHHAELDGGDYMRLRPAAEALAEKYPAAATLLHRALAEDVLRRASSRQYKYAARDVRACAGLAALLPQEDAVETHDAFMARLKREHPRKTGFWSLLEQPVR